MHLSERYEIFGCNFGVNLFNHLIITDYHIYIYIRIL